MTTQAQLQHALQGQEEILKNALATYEALTPNTENLKRFLENYIKFSDKMTEAAIAVAETLKPIQNIQLQWLKTVSGHSWSKEIKNQKNKIRLIRASNGRVFFAMQVKKPRKQDSLHFLVLKALLTESDGNGFISYEKLDEYLVKNGRKHVKNKKKRIWDALREFKRFLGVPECYNEVQLVEKIRGKGLRLHNPEVEQ